MSTTRTRIVLALTVFCLSAAVAVAAAQNDTNPAAPQESKLDASGRPLKPPPPTPFDPAAYETAIADAKVAGAQRLGQVIAEANAGKIDYLKLPVREIGIFDDLDTSTTLDALARQSEVSLLGRVERVEFFDGKFGGMPAKRLYLRVLSSPGISDRVGEVVTIELPGGPSRDGQGNDYFLIPPLGNREQVGQRLLVFVTKPVNSQAFVLTHAAGELPVAANGNVADTPAARAAKLVGARTGDVQARAGK